MKKVICLAVFALGLTAQYIRYIPMKPPVTCGSPVAGMDLWLKSDAGVTCSGGCTNGASVTSWADQSGNSRTATTASGTLTYNTAQINGLPAISEASAAWATIGGTTIPANGHETIFVVFNSSGTTVKGFIGSSSNGLTYYVQTTNTSGSAFGLDEASSLFLGGTTGALTMNTGTWYQANVAHQSTFGGLPSIQFRLSRANITSTLSANNNANGSNQVFTYASSTDPFIGSIAEIIYYTSLLSGGNITTNETYLNCRYGI